jgi:hypothetical protein
MNELEFTIGMIEYKKQQVVCLKYHNERGQDILFAKVPSLVFGRRWRCLTTNQNVKAEIVDMLDEALEAIESRLL